MKKTTWLDIKEKDLKQLHDMGLSLGEVIRIYKKMKREQGEELTSPDKKPVKTKLHVPRGLSTTFGN